jgi:hypothetical protein
MRRSRFSGEQIIGFLLTSARISPAPSPPQVAPRLTLTLGPVTVALKTNGPKICRTLGLNRRP